MRIELKKFGTLLISRPAGREASLAARAYLKPKTEEEKIELDFSGVKVLTPSWTDEFLQGLKSGFPNEIVFLPSVNPTVIETLKIL